MSKHSQSKSCGKEDGSLTEGDSLDSGIKSLISRHSEKKGKKIIITHPGFSSLPAESRRVIELILSETYRNDFEILRKAFDEKLELYLRTTAVILGEAKCGDEELKGDITQVRQAIAEVLQGKTLNDEDIRWLNKIGFNRADIIDLSCHCDIPGVIAELRQYADTYQVILGDRKYIKKILRMPAGLRKLRAIRTFNPAIKFNGYHLSQIVRNAGWEEKLRYFEDPEKLRRLTGAGFEASHLSQIVVNKGWEEKLNLILSSEGLRLALSEGGITHSELAKMLRKKNWRELIGQV
ncbi:MAG: hypothetical protein V1880_02940 [Patescibacteria group bacterium]